MAIILRGKTEMPVTGRLISRLLHGTKNHIGNHGLDRRSLYGFHGLLYFFRRYILLLLIDPDTLASDKFQYTLDLLRIRFAVNSVDKWYFPFAELFRNGFICRQHEIFDETGSIICLLKEHIRRNTFFIQKNFGFRKIKIDRSAHPSAGSDFEREIEHITEHGDKILVLCQKFLIAHGRIAVGISDMYSLFLFGRCGEIRVRGLIFRTEITFMLRRLLRRLSHKFQYSLDIRITHALVDTNHTLDDSVFQNGTFRAHIHDDR